MCRHFPRIYHFYVARAKEVWVPTAEWAVNQYCLLDSLDDAFSAAKRFGVEQPEPGRYVVIEVLEREG